MIFKTLEFAAEEGQRAIERDKKSKPKRKIDKAVQSNLDDYLIGEKLFNDKNGIVAKELAIIRAGLKVLGIDISHETPEEHEINNIQERQNNKWKEIGDNYENHIGQRYKDNEYLVIYNGYIRGWEDRGIDLIAISLSKPVRHIIQCKNYDKTTLDIELADKILKNLKFHHNDYLRLKPAEINYYLDDELKGTELIEHVVRSSEYNAKLILYIPYFRVISNPLKKRLKMITSNRYYYGELLIVITGYD